MVHVKQTIFACGPSTARCKCHCPESCEHVWDGPQEEIIGHDSQGEEYVSGASVTCSRCGASAFGHDMWVAP